MAIWSSAELDAVVRKRHMPRVTKNAYQFSPLWKMLWDDQKEVVEGGLAIDEPITHPAASDTHRYDGLYGTLATISTPNLDKATAEWIWLDQPVSVAIGELRVARGKEALLKLLDKRFDKAQDDFRNQLGIAVYGIGGSGAFIDGFGLAIDDSTKSGEASYLGIDRTASAWWAGNLFENSGVGRELTHSIIRQMRTACRFGSKPRIGFTSDELMNKILSQYDTQKELKTETLTVGWEWDYFNFDGMKIYVDELIPNDGATLHRLLLLTLGQGSQKFIRLYCLKGDTFTWDGFIRPADQRAKLGHFFNTMNLGVLSPQRQAYGYDFDPNL